VSMAVCTYGGCVNWWEVGFCEYIYVFIDVEMHKYQFVYINARIYFDLCVL
jgi:hypothetical protein